MYNNINSKCKMTKIEKIEVVKEIQKVFNGPETNVKKLARITQIVVRVNAEEKKQFNQLAMQIKQPLSKVVRSTLKTIYKHKATPQPLTPEELAENLKAFQRELGLIS